VRGSRQARQAPRDSRRTSPDVVERSSSQPDRSRRRETKQAIPCYRTYL